MKKIIFATSNPNKRREVEQMVQPKGIEIIGLDQLGHEEEVPENQATLEGNALEKAEFIFRKYGEPCFSEDTGLEVDGLGGAPGVITARYAGPKRSAVANMDKLLREMSELEDRRAQFRTVICFKTAQTAHYFEGIVRGRIARGLLGDGGFGYDPIFIPDGFEQSFAQLDATIKNRISHRAKAWNLLMEFL